MNKWKIAFWCCLVILVFIGTLSMYIIMDQSVTLTYQKEGYTNTENDLDQIIELINNTDLSKSGAIPIFQKHKWSKYIDFNSDTIPLERVLLIFEDDNLIKISKQW